MIERLKSNDTPLYVIAAILLIPALLINLGKLPFFIADDEATRALVALEMIIREKYSYSTLNGLYYYNKPPLYNWIIAGFYNLFNSHSEFVSRLPNIVGLLLFGLSIYLFLKNYYTRKQSALIAFAFITSGRILFWESFMCLIDITFSFLIFTMFMVIFHFGEKKSFYKLFIFAYFIAALAFLMKGLPAVVFLGITLLIYFVYSRKFNSLFRLSHFVGMFVFLIVTGLYYYSYWLHNPDSFVFEKLLSESTGRFSDYTFLDVLERIYMFPVEIFYHFLPWTILLIFLLKRGLYDDFIKNRLISFCLLIFFFNVIPYWTAPGFFPRYILMLVPLIYIILFDFYFHYTEKYYIRTKILNYLFGFALICIALLYITLPLFEKTSHYPYIWFVSVLFLLFAILIFFIFIKLTRSRMILIIIALLSFRIIFGLYIWPLRHETVKPYKDDALTIAELTKDEEVEILFWHNLHHGLSFYLTKEKWKILPTNRTGIDIVTNKFYIIDENSLREVGSNGFEYDQFMKFKPMDEWRNIYLIKFTEIGENPDNNHFKK